MEKYYIWLILAFGEGSPDITRLLRDHGSAENAYEAFRENRVLIGAENAMKAGQITLEKAEKTLADIRKLGIQTVTIDSPDYPETLRKLENPPCMLFASGNTKLLRNRLLTVVGSRAMTDYTQFAIPKIISDFGGRYTIVGTLSEGCDQMTCMSAVKYNTPFIEVMPCGLSQTYPTGSRTVRRFLLENDGLLISECLPKTRSSPLVFNRRSRILGGISKVTLVLQAGAESGALATAEQSPEPLFLPPHSVFEKEYVGTVSAIRKGCRLFFGMADIETAFELADSKLAGKSADATPKLRKPKPHNNAPAQETGNEAGTVKPDKNKNSPEPSIKEPGENEFESADHYKLYRAICEIGSPAGAEELIAKTGIPAGKAAELLVDLELDGRITNEHNKFTAT